MPHIRELPSHVADLIAAGEVVERPASVVKELLENAIDAGATAVTVEIRSGGMSLIRVTDDGCGIAPEEAETAFLRHATSKLRTAEDLAAIGTLGFRGEALAAIAAVSRVELLTRQRGSDLGISLTLEAGVPGPKEPAGCPEGTSIAVRDLFFNTPARMKFMKKDSAEGAAVFQVVQQAALSHPELSLRFVREGKEELHSPGDGKRESAVYAVFGRDFLLGSLPVKGESSGTLQVTGFATRPTCCRGTRAQQRFFVNGRPIRSALITAAVEEAYQNRKMVGRFPGCVLWLTLPPESVDVNVHPTKLEIKFQSDRPIFDLVHYAVKAALDQEAGHPALKLGRETAPKEPPRQEVKPKPDFFKTMDPEQFRKAASAPAPKGPESPRTPGERRTPPALHSDRVSYQRESARPRQPAIPDLPFTRREAPVLQRRAEPKPEPKTEARPAPAPTQESLFTGEDSWRLIGEFQDTYLLVEAGAELLLIDKHAAHERLLFDKLRSRQEPPMSQMLLAPVVLKPDRGELEALLQALPLLEELGFEAEDFGGGSLLIRRAPWDLPAEEIGPALSELAEQLLQHGRAGEDARRDAVLHTMACKAAVKAGMKSSREEQMAIAAAVMADRVKYCPHGRPAAVSLDKKELEKQFGRA